MFKLDRRVVALFAVFAVTACRGEDGTTSDGGSTGTTDAGTTTDVPTTTVPTTTDTTTDGTTTAVEPTTTDDLPTTTTNNSNAFLTMTASESDTNNDEPQPNGAACTSDDDCISMNCFISPLAPDMGICAVCNEDQDCVDAGTGISCSADLLGGEITCSDGSLGDQCMSQAACQEGLVCDAVIEVPIPGILPDTCGECGDSGDCEGDDICSPEIDMMTFSGAKVCVAPGSVPNNQLCPKGPEGNDACSSGHCGSATIMGIVEVFICGECTTDDDCEPGQTCTPAEASMSGLSGALCE